MYIAVGNVYDGTGYGIYVLAEDASVEAPDILIKSDTGTSGFYQTQDSTSSFSNGVSVMLNGEFHLSGGELSAVFIGVGGGSGTSMAEFKMSEGTVTLEGQGAGLYIRGPLEGEDGIAEITGGTLDVNGDIDVANTSDGDGTLKIFEDPITSTIPTILIEGSLKVGGNGDGTGTLDINDEPTISIEGSLILGASAILNLNSTSQIITMDGEASAFVIDEDTVANDVSGLGNLTLVFNKEDGSDKEIEVAGEDDGTSSANFNTAHFVLDKLVVGRSGATGPITIRLVDDENNVANEDEALYVETLEIRARGVIELGNGTTLYHNHNGGRQKYFPGDADYDGDVDGIDYGFWQTNYPTYSGATLAEGDFDNDGDVDIDDYGIWLANYPSN